MVRIPALRIQDLECEPVAPAMPLHRAQLHVRIGSFAAFAVQAASLPASACTAAFTWQTELAALFLRALTTRSCSEGLRHNLVSIIA